ncbi:MAG: TrkA-N [Acidobacteriales bacterium]|nr:TrkA-N [Terriglobales bacterium]
MFFLYNPAVTMTKTWKRIRILLVVLAMCTLLGTVGYHYIEGWPWFDSLYMVVLTFSTVGFAEVHPLSHLGRVFTIGLILVGVGLVYFAIGTMTYALLEFEIEKVFGRRKMAREIERLTGHYIICGAGRVGQSSARELARRPVPFVIIESNKPRFDNFGEEGGEDWLIIEGDATKESVLRQARIDTAIGLVAATTTDATNIYIVLTARGLNPNLKIIARASEEDAEKHLKKAGADSVVSPYAFAGHRIAQSFLRPNVVDFLDVAISHDDHHEMVIEEILVNEKSRLAGTTVGSSYIHRDMGIMILAIKHADGAPGFNPTATQVINPGDYLIVMGEAAKMVKLEAIAAGAAK